jgi:hypothetical protein
MPAEKPSPFINLIEKAYIGAVSPKGNGNHENGLLVLALSFSFT